MNASATYSKRALKAALSAFAACLLSFGYSAVAHAQVDLRPQSAVSASAPATSALSRHVGLGIIIGDINGVAAKFRLRRSFALDLGVGADVGYNSGVSIYANPVWHFPVAELDAARIDVHLGIGPEVTFYGDGGYFANNRGPSTGGLWVTARAPIGVTSSFHRVPIDVFIEFAPGLVVFPAIGFDFDAALGARFYLP